MTTIDEANFNAGGAVSGYFDSTFDPGTDVTTSVASALNGTAQGSAWLVDDDSPHTYSWFLSLSTTSYRQRFWIDPNSITIPGAGSAPFFRTVLKGTVAGPVGVTILRITINYNSGAYSLSVQYLNDAQVGTLLVNNQALSDAPHCVEVRVKRAASAVSSDGECEAWLDGGFLGLATNIDNYDIYNGADLIDAEITANSFSAGVSGTFYFDEWITDGDGTAKLGCDCSHIWLSDDGAATFTDIGDPAWGSQVIGGVVIKGGTSYQTVWAMVGTELYKTINGGSTWTLVADVGYETDFVALLDNDVIFVANNSAGGNRASRITSGGTVTHINTGKSTTGGATSGDGIA
jgi:hypothetical protein